MILIKFNHQNFTIMKKFNNIESAIQAVEKLAVYYSDVITITNITSVKGIESDEMTSYYIDLTANLCSFIFLENLMSITGDFNPVIAPMDEETIRIGTYVLINGSGE